MRKQARVKAFALNLRNASHALGRATDSPLFETMTGMEFSRQKIFSPEFTDM
jgi:hypothetical protein